MQKGGDKLGYEAEAFAIYDTMKYIKPEVHTLCVGTAFGESAMLLASGTPVRFLLLLGCHWQKSCKVAQHLLILALHPLVSHCQPLISEKSSELYTGQEGCSAIINNHAASAHAAIPADAGI